MPTGTGSSAFRRTSFHHSFGGALPKLPRIKPPVRKNDDRAVKLEFGGLLKCHGTYVLARRALRRARDEQLIARSKRLENEHKAQFEAAELATVVRLSTTTGTPTLTNPIEQQIARRKKRMPKPDPPPRPEPVNSRTKFVGALEGEAKNRVDRRRLDWERSEVAASIQRDFQRQQRVIAAFKEADDGNGKLDRGEFDKVLEIMGLAGRDDPSAKDLGIPSRDTARERSETWWTASDCDRSGSITVTEALLVLPDAVCDALAEDERTRAEILEYRETVTMEGEDFDAADLEDDEDMDTIARALAWPTGQEKGAKIPTSKARSRSFATRFG